jgi:hypothetical protein
MSMFVVAHDCDRDNERYVVIGPFGTDEEARSFIARHDLDRPLDGGYAFAVVVSEDMEGLGDPATWDAELAAAISDDEA